MKEEQDTLLHNFYCLENQNQPVSVDSIKRNLSWSGNIHLVVEDKIKRLVEKGYLTTENNNIFSLQTFCLTLKWIIQAISLYH